MIGWFSMNKSSDVSMISIIKASVESGISMNRQADYQGICKST